MNAMALMFLTLLAGQIAPGTEKDFGWEIDPRDNALQYIVQVAPEEAVRMQQKSVQFPNGQEITSEIPNELVGRATRVVFRIGTMDLPRNPSLKEIELRFKRFGDPINPSSTAQLDPGVFKQLETPAAYNIGQDNQPTQPMPLPKFPNEPLRDNALADAARANAGGMRDDPSDALSSAMSGLAVPDLSAPESNFPDSRLLAQGGSDAVAKMRDDFLSGASGTAEKFKSLPKPDSMQPGNVNSPTNSGFLNNSGQAANSNGNAGNPNGWPNARTQANTPPLSNPYPSMSSGQSQPQSPVSTFGQAPSSYDRLTGNPAFTGTNRMTQPTDPYGPQSYSANNGQGINSQTTPGFTSAPLQGQYDPRTPPLSAYPNARLARSDKLPSLGGDSPVGGQGGAAGNAVQSDVGGATTIPASDTALKLSFLVSLLVNLYLGILLRKLLARFRAAVAQVRSQMA
jgi:hypothetical protein